MKQFLLLLFLPFVIMANIHPGNSKIKPNCPGEEISLNQFQWENRIIVMFAKNSKSKPYQRQMNKLSSLENELLDRDLVLISIYDNECSMLDGEIMANASANDIRSRLSPPMDGYSIFLIGKDGGIKLKKDEVLVPEQLFRVIDRMPMRQREMRDGK